MNDLRLALRLARGLGGGLRRRRIVRVIALERHYRKTSLAPVVDHAVVRDGVQPGREACLRRVARTRLDDAHPDLLEQLLGDASLLDAAQHEAVQTAFVPRVERFEGRRVARRVGEHQLFIRGLHARVV